MRNQPFSSFFSSLSHSVFRMLCFRQATHVSRRAVSWFRFRSPLSFPPVFVSSLLMPRIPKTAHLITRATPYFLFFSLDASFLLVEGTPIDALTQCRKGRYCARPYTVTDAEDRPCLSYAMASGQNKTYRIIDVLTRHE